MLTVKITPPVGTIIIDRTSTCNALDRNTIAELKEAFDDLRQEKRVRGVVLTAAGKHFCAGLDLKEMHATSTSDEAMLQWHQDAQQLQELVEQMLRMPKPIIAAVDGKAIGSGFALALACDLIVASHAAEFSVSASRLGIVSGLLVPLLTFRAGGAVASQFLLGGAELSAAEAKNHGLVQHVVASDQIWVRSSTWIQSIAESAAESLQLTKRVLNEMVGEELSTMLSSGAAAMATSLTTEAASEGLAAFAEKREPNFP